jgi:hypothetical protein
MMAARPPETSLTSGAIAQFLIWSGHNCVNFAGMIGRSVLLLISFGDDDVRASEISHRASSKSA